jgi:zinc/manganese transport system substrate-binding protein
VAGTNVYADIAQTVGGDRVEATALITGTSQDPHSYEATARDRLTVSRADLVIENGGGYDPFLDTLAGGLAADRIITATEVAAADGSHAPQAAPETQEPGAADEHDHSHGGFNEHIWYHMDSMAALADEISSRLSAIDPAGARTYRTNADTFDASLAAISGKLGQIRKQHGGGGVALTEPLPAYMLEAAGLENRTPEEFLEAVEEGQDAPVAALKAATDLVSSGSVRFLAFNNQTASPQTEEVRKAAETEKLPVLDFTETLPAGQSFIEWMTRNADNIAKALQHS